jgi:hypothetical protein
MLKRYSRAVDLLLAAVHAQRKGDYVKAAARFDKAAASPEIAEVWKTLDEANEAAFRRTQTARTGKRKLTAALAELAQRNEEVAKAKRRKLAKAKKKAKAGVDDLDDDEDDLELNSDAEDPDQEVESAEDILPDAGEAEDFSDMESDVDPSPDDSTDDTENIVEDDLSAVDDTDEDDDLEMPEASAEDEEEEESAVDDDEDEVESKVAKTMAARTRRVSANVIALDKFAQRQRLLAKRTREATAALRKRVAGRR